jgi:hypothetical protein
MSTQDTKLRYGRLLSVLVPAWLLFVWLMFIPGWHPGVLVSRMLPILPQDVLEGWLRLLGDGMPALGMLFLVVLAAIGSGRLLLILFRIDADKGQGLNLSFALGLAALSLYTFFLGIMQGYNQTGRVVSLAVMIILSVAGVAFVIRRPVVRARRKPDWPDIVFVALLVIVGVFLFAKALWPAVFYDAVTYHLGVPNYYIQEGGISYIPYDSYSNFPFMAEMLYTLGMLVQGLKLAQLMSVAVLIASSLMVYDFARVHVRDVPPALPAIFFLLTPAFMEMSVLYGNDLHLAYYSLLVVYCYLMLERDGGYGWAAMMGVFTGVCIGTKYIALVSITLPAFAAVCWYAFTARGRGVKVSVAVVFWFWIPALLVASPWLIKNLAYTGNPFYPAFYNLLDGKDMTRELYAVHKMNHPSFVDGLKGLVMHPWMLFMSPPSYLIFKYRAASFLGPALMFFVPLIVFVKGVAPTVKKLMVFSVMLFVLWSMAFPLTRYLYPAVIAMLIVAAYALWALFCRLGWPLKGVLTLGTAACLVFNVCLGFFLVDRWTNAYGFAHAGETDYQYLIRRTREGKTVKLQNVPAYEYINHNAGKDARVLVIGDAEHLYIKRRHLYTYLSAVTPYDMFLGGHKDNAKLYSELRGLGITHIVYNPVEMETLSRSGFIRRIKDEKGNIERFLGSGYVRRINLKDGAGMPVYLFVLAQ